MPAPCSRWLWLVAGGQLVACAAASRLPPPPSPPEDAIAFAARFVGDLGGPDEALLARIDLRTRLVAASCLYSWEGDLAWCGTFRELDRVLADPAEDDRERRHTLAIARTHLGPGCAPAGDPRPIRRDVRVFGTLRSDTGETDATTAELERYRQFIAGIAEEVVVRFSCPERDALVFVARFLDDPRYFITGSTDEVSAGD